MKPHRLLLLVVALVVIAACESSSQAPAAATYVPFPTVTTGYTLHGVLATPGGGGGVGVNPATVEALAHRPTATPNTGACPPLSDLAELSDLPATGDAIAHEIVRFLSAGGSAVTLEEVMRDDWAILGENGFVRSDIDLTGDGAPEVILGYVAPSEGGTLLIIGCEEGHSVVRHEVVFASGETPPVLILLGDTTHDGINNVVFATQHCDEDEECVYWTHLIAWKPEMWRFVSLLGATIETDELPEVIDADDDLVGEIVVRMERYGSLSTGPLRTGINIYDWNGSVYVLSIIQLDPVRYRIHVIHAADRRFRAGTMSEAISLYQRAFTDESLRTWLNDEEPILDSYLLYRMLVARAASDDAEAQAVYQYILDTFIDPAQTPIYVELSRVFWDTFQIVNNLTAACREVQNVIEEHPEAVDLLNRYGSRNPTYTARDLCPF